MPKGGNTMDIKSDEKFLFIEATIEANKQDTDEKITRITENQKETNDKLTLLLTAMKIDKNNI